MNSSQLDRWVNSLAGSRRALVGAAIASWAGSGRLGGQHAVALGDRRASTTSTERTRAVRAEATPVAARSVCASPDASDVHQREVGDLVDYEEITALDDPNFPSAARAWRVLYVSTNQDNTSKVLICGVVIAPAAVEEIMLLDNGDGPTARVVAWCHGTLGMTQRCQPSSQPESEIWGPTPYGIGALSLGSADAGDLHVGEPEDGMLAGMIAAGWVVTATDFLTGLGDSDTLEPYANGKVEAANTIDSLRAAHQLLQHVYPGYAGNGYDVVTWGHSQGGHAALWTGQLLDSYVAATAAAQDPRLLLAGVALEAPGSNFIVQPDKQPEALPASGMLDWLANAKLQVTGVSTAIPLAPFLFSYMVGTWAQQSEADTPAPDEMPAFPATGALDMTAIVMPDALGTVADVNGICWADGDKLVEYTTPYLTTPFLQPDVANGPMIGNVQAGNLGVLCSGTPHPELDKWCSWLRYNIPGPLGVHPMAKLPRRGDQLAPVLIAHGSGDGVVHCMAPEGQENDIPPASDCMSVALYDAMQSEFCPDAGNRGALRLRIWRAEPGVTDASHSAITALPGAASTTKLAFAGSMLQQFMQEAFDGAVTPGCSVEVVNRT